MNESLEQALKEVLQTVSKLEMTHNLSLRRKTESLRRTLAELAAVRSCGHSAKPTFNLAMVKELQ